MIKTSTSLLLFTSADIGGKPLFRAVRVDVEIVPGEGRLWVDLSRGNGFTTGWQRHLKHLVDVGRARYELPWDRIDLRISSRARGVVLDGASASLPLFVVMVALLSGASLPDPFFATGVALEGSDALSPAPRAYLQGKLAVADSIARQVHGAKDRYPVWVPAGSDYDASAVSAVAVREAPTLCDAVQQILGLPAVEARPAALERP